MLSEPQTSDPRPRPLDGHAVPSLEVRATPLRPCPDSGPHPDLHQPALQIHRPAVSEFRTFLEVFRTSSLTFSETSRHYHVKRVRAAWRALVHYRLWRCWYAFLLSSPLAAIARHHPRFYEKPFRPYLHRNLTRAESYRVIREHYLFVQQHAPVTFLAALLENRPFLLNEQSVGDLKAPLYVNLGYARHMRQEGELTLSLGTLESHNATPRHEWIASLTFVVHLGASGWEILIGGVQGGHAGGEGKDGAKLATRVFHGLRPKFLLIDILRQVAGSWNISHIYAVGDDAHVFRRRRYRNRINIRSSYNDLWREAGGQAVANGFFLLPAAAHRRSPAEIPSNKRAEYARRYDVLDAIHEEVHAKLASLQQIGQVA
ncbi:MAG TPA: DUF535 family protein [Gammaproteobacteria bacterium]|nr:DUF535 family protein [Gammaproteobacteria bacterium]